MEELRRARSGGARRGPRSRSVAGPRGDDATPTTPTTTPTATPTPTPTPTPTSTPTTDAGRRRARRHRHLHPPRSLDDDRRGGGRRPPRRGPGGPNDGGPGRAARTGRRLGLYVIVVVAHRHLPAVQRRHRPVDRRAVVPQRRFRLGLLDAGRRRRWVSGVAAFARRRRRLPRQPVAGRTARPAALGRRRRARCGRSSAASTRPPRRPTTDAAVRVARRSVPAATGSATARPSPSRSATCPISRRSPAGSSAGSPCSSPCSSAGRVSGAWETVLLYLNRVPFSPTASVTDPIFGRDIGFFLFELPFLRLVQGLFNGIVLAALVLTLARYLVGASRGGLVFSTPIRVHLAVLGGLFLLSVAFGYQLDKLELVYSTRGVATGVSFTDQNAQFLAFDAADDRVRDRRRRCSSAAAFTRTIWPLGLTIAVWFVASLVIGRLYPEADPALHGRAQQVRPGRALHRQQHRDDAAGLRPRRVGQRLVRGGPAADRGADHEGGRHLRQRPAVGPASAADDARPAPDRAQVLRLHRRRHGPLRRSTASRAR